MADPFIDDVILLANFTAKDGHTAYTPDVGDFFNFNANAVIQDTVTLFGNTTLYLDGTGDYADTGAVNLYNFFHLNDEDFTIEIWLRFPDVSSTGWAFATRGSTNYGLVLGVNAGGQLQCTIYDNVGDRVQLTEAGNSISIDTWYYVTVTRTGGASGPGSYEIKLDNVSKATDTYSTIETGNCNASLTFGKTAVPASSLNEIEVYIGPIRITKGVGRTISGVPTDIFDVPADDDFPNVISLLNFEDMPDGTTITDSAPITIPIPWTANNGATITSGVLILDGVNDYIDSDDRTDIRDELNGTNSTNWTMEIKLKTNDVTSAMPYWDIRPSATSQGILIRQPGSPADEIKLSVGDSTAGYDAEVITTTQNLTVGEVVEVAVTRNGSDYLLHVDGLYIGKDSTAVALDVRDNIWIGAFVNLSSGWLDGEVYRTRITKDVSRYGEFNYSPYPYFRYPAPPFITTEPVDEEVNEGEVATFTVVADNVDTYQWYETTTGLLSGETAATLDFTTVIGDDGNSYYCDLTNDDGIQSTVTVNLTVRLLLNVYVSDDGLLGEANITVLNDFESLITDITHKYIMNITGTPILELPISSWQGTSQSDQANYAQCVIPNVDEYIEEILARQDIEDFIIYRVTDIQGIELRSAFARAPVQTVNFSEGAFKSTAVLQGYTSAPTSNTAPKTRIMQNIRTENTTSTGLRRVRCDMDWFLIPGDTATVRGDDMTVVYINYFVSTSGDIYMDIGDR